MIEFFHCVRFYFNEGLTIGGVFLGELDDEDTKKAIKKANSDAKSKSKKDYDLLRAKELILNYISSIDKINGTKHEVLFKFVD